MELKDFSCQVKQNQIKGKIFCQSDNYSKINGLVILCHGIPGGKKDPRDPGYGRLAETLCAEGYQSVVFNFRGAGESTGDFDIRGWADDLRGLNEYFSSRLNNTLPVVLFAFSAGAAVAIYACAHDARNIAGLILCGCPADFDSILRVRGVSEYVNHCQEIGIIKTPGFPFDRSEWAEGFRIVRPERWISDIKATPKLIIHGDHDEVVPVEHAYRLYDHACDPKQLVIIKGGGHRLRLDNQAMETARDWLRKSIGNASTTANSC